MTCIKTENLVQKVKWNLYCRCEYLDRIDMLQHISSNILSTLNRFLTKNLWLPWFPITNWDIFALTCPAASAHPEALPNNISDLPVYCRVFVWAAILFANDRRNITEISVCPRKTHWVDCVAKLFGTADTNAIESISLFWRTIRHGRRCCAHQRNIEFVQTTMFAFDDCIHQTSVHGMSPWFGPAVGQRCHWLLDNEHGTHAICKK